MEIRVEAYERYETTREKRVKHQQTFFAEPMNIPCSLPMKKANEQGDFYVQHTLGLFDL